MNEQVYKYIVRIKLINVHCSIILKINVQMYDNISK